VLTNLHTTFDEINNEQDKLISEFVKKIDIHITDILRDVNQINIEANVIVNVCFRFLIIQKQFFFIIFIPVFGYIYL
jgi:hypothetical protein